jgi:hypothetical protein
MADDAHSMPARMPHSHSPQRSLRAWADSLTPREMRATLEAALERLLAAADTIIADLDILDGDADLEPSLGFLEVQGFRSGPRLDQRLICAGANDDREEQCDDDGAEEVL